MICKYIVLNEAYKIPNNSVASIQDNPLGISSISIVLGNASAYIKSGDTIQTAPANSLLGDFVNTLSPLGEKTNSAIISLDKVLNNINHVLDDKNRQNLALVLENLAITTKSLNSSMANMTIFFYNSVSTRKTMHYTTILNIRACL